MLRLHQYSLDTRIEGDEYGALYRGHSDADRRPILAKVLADEYPSLTDIARLRHEHAVESELDLEGVVTPLGLEAHGHGVVLVLQDPGGVTLSSLLGPGPLELALALRIAASLATTLAAVHARHVIHKDVNPANILVDVQTGRTHLFGFGIAARLSSETAQITSAGALEGTLAYLSPEQTGRMNRIVDRRSDLYSLGAVLYELLTGTPPFPGTDAMELLYSHLVRRPEPPQERVSALPRVVSDLAMRLLEKNAEDRYQHAGAVAQDLRECLARLDPAGALPPFVLGQGDRQHDGELDIPQRLYGREPELDALRSAWQRVNAGAAELLLVRGYSGIGKSVLVHEIHKDLTGARGHFIAGKFDQLGRAVPYAALAAAFRELVHLRLTEHEHELEQFRTTLLAAVGDSGHALTELVPDLERIIGPQPQLPELGGAASRSRLARVFAQLVQVCTGDGRPLVLFLDDLQWADLASLELLEALFKVGENRHLLVIGAYRSNEVDALHPLTATLSEIEASAQVNVIELGPLGRGDVLRFIADALGMEVESVASLAGLVHERTEGNPFFLIQLLVALHKDGLLRYDEQAQTYRWDLARVRATAASDNVVQFMGERIQRLSAPACRALELAACVGYRFDLATMAIIAETTPRAIASDLWEALVQRVILPVDTEYRLLQSGTDAQSAELEVSFRFQHDRVQQAAYARMDEPRRAALHLKIGRLMLLNRAALGDGHEDDPSFELVAHLNVGRALITDPNERSTLARLNLAAGTKARAATAYEAAYRYFAVGISQLDEDSFDRAYPLAFALYLGDAEAAMLAGAPEDAEASIDILLPRARTPLERAEVLDLCAVMLAAQGRSADAVVAGLEGLRLLGFEVPDTEAGQREAYERSLAAVAEHMFGSAGRSIDELASGADMNAPDKRAAMKLARHTALSAFGSANNLGYWLTALAAELSLVHGSSDQSSSAYSLLGAVVASTTTHFAQAHELVKLGLAVHERRGGDMHEACMLGFYFTTVSHYAMHWRSLLPYLERARVAGVESGDLLFHSYTCSHKAIARSILGDPLDEVREEVERMLALMHKHKLASAAATQTVVRQTIACLEGRTSSPTSLGDELCDEAELVATIEGARMSFALYWYRTSKGTLLYLAGDHEGALEQLEPVMAMAGIAFTPEARFFTALAILGSETLERRASLLARCQQDLTTWAEACPANYRHRQLLVEAEVARRSGSAELAMDRYDQAISAAHEHEWPRDLALANELAAKFYLARGRTRIARAYMTDASYAYGRWGAVARVRQLAEQFSGLVPIEAQRPRSRAHADEAVDEVDMIAFARSLQLIAREVLLDNVVDRMMRIVLQSAGAQRGVLILEREGALVVYARVTADSSRVMLALGVPLEDSDDLPASVVRYVARLMESVVLDDAMQDERFAGDPYIVRARPRSIACLAMTHQGRGRGVLYLENNASTAAFTTGRVELLGLLSAQAVISIDNADLYARVQAVTDELSRANATLEAEVVERVVELRVANDRLTVELAERARAEAERLFELSTPVIPLSRAILLVPLIGNLDHHRAGEMLEAALTGAHERGAQLVIFDVTGIKGVAAGVAAVLVSTTRALRLVGANVIVTGVGPRMALEWAEQEVELDILTTRSSLEEGIAEAMARVAGRGGV